MHEIIDYWFSDSVRKYWFASTPDFDERLRDKYNGLWESAKQGKPDHWKESADGCLALCIILDQLPLNMFRGTAKSFSTERQAVGISKQAVAKGFDQQINKKRVSFLYMPLMHSERLADQALSVQLFEKAGLENNLRFAKHHRDLIKKFGRFPHRNKVLGRKNTQAEIDYLNSKQAFTG